MLRYLRSRREVLHARIETGKITVSDKRGNVLAVLIHKMDADPYFTLKPAGFYMVEHGWPSIVPDGRPFTILVRRRLVSPSP